ncbi:MAG: hypothetical protein JKY45_00510 [Emcibacter sp.]|nr:hypothetical protein [Emcibacter sp.]
MNGWGNGILSLASNIYWVVGIFIFFTLLLHFLFVVWFPLSLRAWKLADYLWLTLAFLSTLGLVGEARQYQAETSHYESEWQATQSLSGVRNWYSHYQIFICSEAKALKDKNLKDTQYHKLCNWLEGRINDLNLMQNGNTTFSELSPTGAEDLQQYGPLIPRIEQKILTRRIAQYNDKRTLHLDNLKERERTTLQMIMVIIAPVMLAFALAIRFTKVTGEYRLLNPGKKKR